MPTEKRILVNEVEISYFQTGADDALPLLFIHGFPFNKLMWTNQLETLKDKYRCIAYDVRGHGQSQAGEKDFSMDLFGDDLLAFLDALQIKEAVVCGLSMGGYIALNAIQKQPNRSAGGRGSPEAADRFASSLSLASS